MTDTPIARDRVFLPRLSMPSLRESALARAESAVGRIWPITCDLTTDGRVVSLRHAKLNARLVPMRATGQVFARVLEVSVSTRTGAPSLYPTVTVAFSNDE